MGLVNSIYEERYNDYRYHTCLLPGIQTDYTEGNHISCHEVIGSPHKLLIFPEAFQLIPYREK